MSTRGITVCIPGLLEMSTFGSISDPWMGPYPPRLWRNLKRCPEGQLLARAGSMSLSQSATSLWGWSFHIVWGGIDPEDRSFRVRVVGVEDIWKALRSGDGTLSSPGCAGFIYEHQPISDRPVGLGFPHHAGRCPPGGTPLSSHGCRICRCMEVVLIRGWEPILPGMRWLYIIRAPANQRSASGAGFNTVLGGFDPGDHRFRPQFVGVLKV